MSICPSSLGPLNIQIYKIHNTQVIMNKVIIYIQHNQKRVFKTYVLPCKMQHLLTLQVSRYCLLSLQSSVSYVQAIITIYIQN